jgi:hypothetical protein
MANFAPSNDEPIGQGFCKFLQERQIYPPFHNGHNIIRQAHLFYHQLAPNFLLQLFFQPSDGLI